MSIVERLREANHNAHIVAVCTKAADHIEQQAAHIERLEAALHKIGYEPIGDAEASYARVCRDMTEIAREALGGEK